MSLRRPLLPLVVLVLSACLCPSCAETGEDAWQPPTVVRVEGFKQAQVISPAYGVIFGSAVGRTGEDGAALAPAEDASYVLARPGELLGLGGGGPVFPYAPSDGTTLAFALEEGEEAARLLLAGKTVAVGLDADEEAGWAWLREAPAEDLARVRFLMLQSDGQAADTVFSETQQAALARLAEANPRVGLAVQGASMLGVALETFDPAWLSLGSVTPDAEVQDLLAAEPRLRTLMMDVDPETGLAFLSRLPHLETLFLSGWEGPREGPLPRLPTIPTLRTLITCFAEMPDLKPIGNQPNLRELAVIVGKDLGDVSRLAEMSGLRAISLQGCEKVEDLSALSALNHLRWLVLPPKATQQQFATVCKEHRDLEVLQAVPCEGITDLAPLANLGRLRVLTLGETQAPLDPVAGLTSLRLLGVDLKFPEPKEGEVAAGETTEEEAKVAEARSARHQAVVRIMDANPDLAVVQVAPLCLGSGWILLLVPATAGAWWLARRRGAAD